MSDPAADKRAAAAGALELVRDGMTLGLGSGSTAEIFVALLGERVAAGLNVAGVPTSENTARAAEKAGVPLLSPDDVAMLDLVVDGADEIDGQFRLIKGGGGCLLREKIVAAAGRAMVVVADSSKLVGTLGAFDLPVEVDPFWMQSTARHISAALGDSGCAGRATALRMQADGGDPFVTDGGNYILDCACREIPEPDLTARLLSEIPGVVEHGLFIGLAGTVIVGRNGRAETVERS